MEFLIRLCWFPLHFEKENVFKSAKIFHVDEVKNVLMPWI